MKIIESSNKVEPKCIIVWDYENVAFTDNALTQFLIDLNKIREEYIQQHIGIIKMYCYGHWGNNNTNVQEIIDTAHFNLIQVPYIRKNAVDHKLMIDILELYHQIGFSHLILIAADGDYFSLCDELQKKGVKIAIMARTVNLSSDLKNLIFDRFYLDPQGHLSRYQKKNRNEQLEILIQALVDAENSLNNLIHRPEKLTSQIFSYQEWFQEYQKLERYLIHPMVINALISFEDLFHGLIMSRGFGHSEDMHYLAIPPSQSILSITDLVISKNLHETQEIRYPLSSQEFFFEQYVSPSLSPENNNTNSTEISSEFQSSKRIESVGTQPTLFLCPHCNQNFSSQSAVNQHINQKHPNKTNSKGLAYPCSRCQRAFGSPDALAQHNFQKHEKTDYICTHCSKKFGTQQALNQHHKMKHK